MKVLQKKELHNSDRKFLNRSPLDRKLNSNILNRKHCDSLLKIESLVKILEMTFYHNYTLGSEKNSSRT